MSLYIRYTPAPKAAAAAFPDYTYANYFVRLAYNETYIQALPGDVADKIHYVTSDGTDVYGIMTQPSANGMYFFLFSYKMSQGFNWVYRLPEEYSTTAISFSIKGIGIVGSTVVFCLYATTYEGDSYFYVIGIAKDGTVKYTYNLNSAKRVQSAFSANDTYAVVASKDSADAYVNQVYIFDENGYSSGFSYYFDTADQGLDVVSVDIGEAGEDNIYTYVKRTDSASVVTNVVTYFTGSTYNSGSTISPETYMSTSNSGLVYSAGRILISGRDDATDTQWDLIYLDPNDPTSVLGAYYISLPDPIQISGAARDWSFKYSIGFAVDFLTATESYYNNFWIIYPGNYRFWYYDDYFEPRQKIINDPWYRNALNFQYGFEINTFVGGNTMRGLKVPRYLALNDLSVTTDTPPTATVGAGAGVTDLGLTLTDETSSWSADIVWFNYDYYRY